MKAIIALEDGFVLEGESFCAQGERTGEVVFNTDLKKMKITPEDAEKLFVKAIKMLNGDCPKETCVWCEKV